MGQNLNKRSLLKGEQPGVGQAEVMFRKQHTGKQSDYG